MPRNNTTTTERPNGRYFFRTRKPVNYVEEDQPDNKNDADYNPEEIRRYWIQKNRTNKLLNQAIAKLQYQTNYTEPVALFAGIINSNNNIATRSGMTRSSKTQTQEQPSRYNLRRR